jgi:hypothetical protein
LKRTELKRTGFIKRGGFIRKRSKTNSKQHENKPLVAEYRAANPLCELHQFPQVPGGRIGQEINHIYSCRKRFDLKSNLIHLSAEAHRWFHAFPFDARICCLWVKWKKNELDDAEIKQASGKFLAGLVSEKEPVFDWVRPLLSELIVAFP